VTDNLKALPIIHAQAFDIITTEFKKTVNIDKRKREGFSALLGILLSAFAIPQSYQSTRPSFSA
jgi:predicted outer membrane lipoprotein